MKELYVVAKPVMFNYSGAIVEDGYLVKELSTIPIDLVSLEEYACEQDCSTIVLCGKGSYVSGLKKQIESNPLTKYNRKINVRIEEVKG